MSGSPSEVRPLIPRGISREGAMTFGVGILSIAAILIAASRRGLFGDVGTETFGLIGLALAFVGFLYLIHIWWADRFRISIGRIMLLVVLLAILLQAFLVYRSWILDGLPKPPGTTAAAVK